MSAPTAPQSEPLLDLQRLVAGIRWRRRSWLTLGLVGIIVGAAVAVFLPHPTAVTRILVVRENDDAGSSEALIKTDVALFQSTPIAAAALTAIGSTDRPEQLLNSITVTGLTGNVLEVTVPGRTDADAVARAQALADAFIADHVKRTQDQDQAQVQGFTDRRDAAQGSLDDLNTQITAAAAAPGANSPDSVAKLEALYARRASLTSQIQALGQQAEQAGVGAPQVQAGTKVVDPPRVLPHSLLSTGLVDAGLGLLLGLGVGIAVCAIATVTRDRPVLRRDIAANLGASIIAQVPAPRRGPLRRRRSREPTEVQRVAGTIVRLSRDAERGLSFLALGSAATAAELAVRVADELAPERPVELVDALPDDSLGPVVERIGSSVPVVDGSGSVAAGGIRLGVGSLEPGTAWTDLPQLGSEAVLVVRAGHAATSWLHTAARQLADGAVHVIGVVVVHPDPRDRSDGTLWSGLQMALRGRQQEPAVPMTAVAPELVAPELVAAVARLVGSVPAAAIAEPAAAVARPVAPVPATPAAEPAAAAARPVAPAPTAPAPQPAVAAARRNGPEIVRSPGRGRPVAPTAAARALAGARAAAAGVRAASVDAPTVRVRAVEPDTTADKAPASARPSVPAQQSTAPDPEPVEPTSDPGSESDREPEPGTAPKSDTDPGSEDPTPSRRADGPSDPHATVQLEPVRRSATGEPVEVSK